MKLKHRRSPIVRDEYASLIFGLVMIAVCWVGCAYILIAYRAENQTAPIATERPDAEAVNRCVDWELIKVLVEIDIRNPSPEHEAFLRAYDRRQNHCRKGE